MIPNKMGESRKKEALLRKGKENKGANQYTPERMLSTIDKTQHNPRQVIADKLGWSCHVRVLIRPVYYAK